MQTKTFAIDTGDMSLDGAATEIENTINENIKALHPRPILSIQMVPARQQYGIYESERNYSYTETGFIVIIAYDDN